MNSQRPNPFPGLRPFRSDEHHLFFGREEQTAALLQLLRTNRFLAVVGTSGSGKSSLVRAGMIAELHGGTMTQAGSTWEVMILRPGGSPIENLARAMVEADLYDSEDPSTLPRLLATLNRSRFGLVEAMKQSEVFEPGTNLLVVVDQFEELFRFRQQGVDSEEVAAAFVNLLLTAGEQAECPIYVAITMRSDYLGDCSEIPGLAEAVNEGEYLIPRLLRDQKRDAIEKPIGVGGAKISPLLVQRLLNDVGDDPDQLPVLQHALMRMWDAWSTGSDHDRPIEFADFEATGGLASALSNHADEIYDSLPDDRHRSACAKIFKTLTEKGNDNRGIRRPTRLAHLQAIAASDRATLTTVLDAFRGSGVTFLMPGTEVELGDRTVLDLSHESLMRGWQRLCGWVEDEAQSARIFRRLLDTARLWKDGKAGLFHDPDLQIALSWREQEAPNAEWAEQYGGDLETAIGFLETSNAEVEAERQAEEAARQRELAQARHLAETQARMARLFKRFAGGLAAGLCLALALTVWAFTLRGEAKRQGAAADEQRQVALENEQSERDARHEAELSREAESSQRQRAEIEKKRADSTLADMYASRGLLAGERDAAAESVLWFAAAADQSATGKDSRRQEDNRLRARNWMRQATLPVGATSLSGAIRQIDFQPRGELLLACFDEAKVIFWSWRDDKRLAWAEKLVGVGSAQFSPDGTSVALGFLSGEAQIRKVSDGELLAKIQHEGQIGAMAFSPDGKCLAIASNIARIWDIKGQAFLNLVWSHPQAVAALVFNRKGDRLVTACNDKLARVFAVDSKQEREEPLYTPMVHTAASPPALIDEDRILVTVSGGSELTRWDMATGKPVTNPIRTKPWGLQGVVASPDGNWFVTGGYNGPELYATDARQPPVNLGHTNMVTRFAFSPDNTMLLSGSMDQTARLWSLPHGQPLGQPLKHMTTLGPCAWSHDARHMATTQIDGLIRVWQRPVEDPVIARESGWGERPRVSFDGRLVVPGLWHEMPGGGVYQNINRLRVIATANGQPAGTDISLPGALVDSCICGDNLAVAAVCARGLQGQLGVWDAATARARFDPITLPGLPISVAARPGSGQLAVICSTGDLLVVDDKTGKRLLELRHEGWAGPPGRAVQVQYTPDGKTLVSLCHVPPATVNVRDADTGRLRFAPLRPSVAGSNFHSFSLSADSRLLATTTLVKNFAQVWDLATGLPLSVPLPHSGDFWGLFSVRFSPDGRHLLTSHKDGQVRYWDWQAGKLACPPMAHADEVYDVVITPNGHFALTTVRGRPEIQLWELTTGRRVAPPVRLGFIEGASSHKLSMTPDGQRVLVCFTGSTTSNGMHLAVVDLAALLSPPSTPTADLALLAELATSRHIELGDLSGLTNEQWSERWKLLRERNPQLLIRKEARGPIDLAAFEQARRLVLSGVGAYEGGRRAEAIRDLQQARDRLRTLHQAAPGDGSVASSLAISLGFLGSALREEHRIAEARDAIQESRKVLEAIGQPSFMDVYNLACAYANLCTLVELDSALATAAVREALAQRAIETLRRSFAVGMTKLDLIERDHDFDPLRERPDFRALILESSGRTREAVPHLATLSAANPKDTLLSLKVAALQAWFGQEKELAATRQRILAFAKEASEVTTCDRAAKACSILPSTQKAELEAALALGRKAVEIGKGGDWNLLALGMAEYRSGNDAAADEALLAAVKAGPTNLDVTGLSPFYRAMSLFRQGKRDEARKLAIAAAAKMKPLPADENNPLAGNASDNDLILWLGYKEAKALIKFDAAPAAPERNLLPPPKETK